MTHTSMTSDMKQFWDFDFEQMGSFDVPAVIDYVLLTTGNSKLGYIGHS
jgi:hypothetical protein